MDIAEHYGIDLTREGKVGCPRCQKNGRDRSNNNLHVYSATESCYCHSCGFTIPSKEHREAMGWDTDIEDEIELNKFLTTCLW